MRLRLYLVALALVAAGIAAGVVAIVVHTQHQRDRDRNIIDRLASADARQQTALVALCALREDRIQNVASSSRQLREAQRYLRKHPNGAPSLGISAADIRRSIADQQRSIVLQRQTITALAVVKCPARKVAP